MKLSVLDMVQDILSDMDSDEVNSISDTVEAMQVAQILKTTYFNMCSNRKWGDQKRLTTLDHSGDISKPTHLKLPENTKELIFLSYNCKKDQTSGPIDEYRKLEYRYPDEFLRIVNTRPRNNSAYEEVTDFGGVKLFIKNNEHPTYWTSFDDKYLICDSYYADLDTTLQASKTQAYLVQMPTWEMKDDFVPHFPVEAFAALLAEAKSTAFLVLKQMANEKAESTSRRQQAWLSRKNSTAKTGVRYQTYGRVRTK